MTDDLGKRVFDLDKLESLEVESARDLRSGRPARRGKKSNPDQFDLFAYVPPTQEDAHVRPEQTSTSGTRSPEHEVQQHDGTQDSELLAGIRTEAGGRPVVQRDIAEDPDAESGGSAGYADSLGGYGGNGAGTVALGSMESPDADRGGRSGRSRGLGDDAGGISEPSISLAYAGDDTEADIIKPSRDYRITAESRVGEGSLREKAELNLDAIQLLKIIEREGRSASDAEKHVLARYTGWGAMPAVFDYYTGRQDEWGVMRDEVKALLSDEEYKTVRASVSNAHFTSTMVVKAMWSAIERLGVGAGARILEPSMGVGNFFGLMPEAFMPRALRAGIELDSITAKIAKHLYQDATIFELGFQDAPFPDKFFDVAIGNVPFGNYGVHDSQYKAYQTASIHDYFFVKSLDKLRVGGVLAFITSRYTMDKKDDAIRQHLASKADFLGAIRLPNTSFKDNAGTVVTTDIIFLQKRAAVQEPVGAAWVNVEEYRSPEGGVFALNEYFIQHPKMMLGTMKLIGSRYGQQPELIGSATADNLRAAIAALPRDIYAPRIETPATTMQPQPIIRDEGAFIGIKNGAYMIVDGVLGIKENKQFVPCDLEPKDEARVRGTMRIRDNVRTVFQTQLADDTDEVIKQARHNLNVTYDRFVAEYGYLSSRANRNVFADDPDAPLMLSLEENYDKAKNKAKKAAIFDRRTLDRYSPVERVETAAEALAVSLNELGRLDWQRMGSVAGRTVQALQHELGALVYENPETSAWETADAYLSGNVRHKLATAHAAAALDKKYQRNILPLEGVQPIDLAPSEITARLGSTWIPTDDLADFVAHIIESVPTAVRVDYLPELGNWSITAKDYVKSNVANTTTYGTTRFTAINLIDDALNGKVPTAYDTIQTTDGEKRVVNERQTLEARETQQKIKDKFAKWIWADVPRASRLAEIYNEKFNSLRLRTYDGSHLTFPGMNKAILRKGDFDSHQKNAVWRILQGDSTLLAHCVGAGKTWIMTSAAMEARRIGLVKKSMMVVPNHLVEQWGTDFLRLYPQANIFVAGKDYFKKGNRQKAMSRIATGNYDAVIVSHNSFELLPVSDKIFDDYMKEELEALEVAIREANMDKTNRKIVKILEAAKKRLPKKIEDRANREKKDNAITFEELGVDRIFVDEADIYKNLGFVTKMTRIAGIPASNSNRAADMHIKTRYLRKQNNGKGVVFATGTPISNTMAELYTMQRYLAPEALEAANMAQFDAWAANFGEAVTSLELAPSGSGYRMHTRFAKFVNLPELLTMFRNFTDVQTPEMLNLPVPTLKDGKNQILIAPASLALKAFVEALMLRADKIKSGNVDPKLDNMLKITNEGRRAALDMRLVNPMAGFHPESKVGLVINELYAIWKETAPTRATQLAFCDISTPKNDRFHVYGAIKTGLIERGVPLSEIAFIHDADTDAAKQTLFEKVNGGIVRILLGSTDKMGAGTNVQKRLYASHNIDAPWRPRDIEQRDGRILRQGNENPEVRIYRYVTEGSFDAYMWQTLETKARFIQQVMNGNTSVRTAEDVDGGALTYAEIKAIASGNPAVMEKVKVDTEVRKLDSLRTSHKKRQFEIRLKMGITEETLKNNTIQLAKVKQDIKTRDANASEVFGITVSGQSYTGKESREAAAQALNAMFLKWSGNPAPQCQGQIQGFDLITRDDANGFVIGFLRGQATYAIHCNPDNPLGTLLSIERTLRGLETVQARIETDIVRDEKAMTEYQVQVDLTFEHEERLKELLEEQGRLNAALDLDKNVQQVMSSDDANGEEADGDDVVIDAESVIDADEPERDGNERVKLRWSSVLEM